MGCAIGYRGANNNRGVGRRGGGLGLGRVAGQSWSRQRGSLSALACAAQGTLTDRAVPMYSCDGEHNAAGAVIRGT